MKKRIVEETLDRISNSLISRRLEEGVKHKGKKISFAELDGPFPAGVDKNGVEYSEYAILYVDEEDNEIDLIVFRDKKKAFNHLNKLEKAGVEVGNLTT